MQGRQASCYSLYLGGVIAAIAVLPAVAWACPVCLGGDDTLAHAMNMSILFLMSMPFLIGASIGGVLFVAYRRAQGQRWPYITTKDLAWSRRRLNRE
jgi:hypothetical protein